MTNHDPVDENGASLRTGTIAPDDPLTRRIICCAVEVHQQLEWRSPANRQPSSRDLTVARMRN